MLKNKNYVLGELQTLRRFPNNYFSMSKDEKLKCDEEFFDSLKKTDEINKNLFYFCEVIFELALMVINSFPSLSKSIDGSAENMYIVFFRICFHVTAAT